MHGSHKLWIMISVFLVVIGLLLGMYFTATPDKVGSIIKEKQTGKMRKNGDANRQPAKAVYEDSTPRETVLEEQSIPDELEAVDLDSIKAENSDKVQLDEAVPAPDGKTAE